MPTETIEPEEKPEEKEEEPKEGSNSLLEKWTKETDRREAIVIEEKKLQKRKEDLFAQQQMHGTAEGGSKPTEETEDEKWRKEAKERWKGTGYDPT